jgi:hypothetical protein
MSEDGDELLELADRLDEYVRETERVDLKLEVQRKAATLRWQYRQEHLLRRLLEWAER